MRWTKLGETLMVWLPQALRASNLPGKLTD
jgi:hypothetical protein